MSAWPQVLLQVTEATRSALSSHPRLSRASLVRWARAEARRSAEIARLSPAAAVAIDRIVDEAIAASS